MYQTVIRDPGGDRLVRIVSGIQPVNGSLLLVPANTTAYFVCNGHISESYPPGKYDLDTGISPFFVWLRHLMTRGDPGITVSVFYISPNLATFTRMGTGEIPFNEKRFNLTMKAMASVTVQYSISDPLLFLTRLVGMHRTEFSQEDLEPAIDAMLLPQIRQQLGRTLSQIPVSQFQNDLVQLSRSLTALLSPSAASLGIALQAVQLLGINISDSELERLRKLEEQSATGHLQTELEKYNMEQIYGNLDKRTLVEVMTGTVRNAGPASSSAPPVSNNISGMAGIMASLPLQIAVFKQVYEAMRDSLDEMTRGNDLFQGPPRRPSGRDDTGAEETFSRPEDPDNGPPPLPPRQ